MSILKREVGSIIASFENHDKYIADAGDATNAPLESLKIRLEDIRAMLPKMREHTYAILADLEEKNDDTDADIVWEGKLKDFEKNYFLLTGVIQTAIANHPQRPQNRDREMHRERIASIKCPKIELPKFDGSPEKWVKFRELFDSLVGNNENLSDVEKYQYLEASITITGAANVLSTFKFSGANYAAAWQAVKDRYEDRRTLLATHLKELISTKKMSSNSAAELRRLLDTFHASIKALEHLDFPLGEELDLANILLMQLLTNKLDDDIVREWRKDYDPEVSTWQAMYDFLHNHWNTIYDLEPTKKSKPIDQVRSPRQEKHAHAARALECYGCGQAHGLWECPDFSRLSIDGRNRFVEEKSLCYNCLGKHKVSACSSTYKCKKCSKRHHTMLHKDRLSVPSSSRSRSKSPLSGAAAPFQPSSPRQSTHSETTENSHVALTMMARKRDTLLSTATILVKGRGGEEFEGRGFVDGGSTVTFMTESFADRCQLRRMKTSLNIGGVGKSTMTVREAVHATVTRKMVSTREHCFATWCRSSPTCCHQHQSKWT